jgi:hypothetical protein
MIKLPKIVLIGLASLSFFSLIAISAAPVSAQGLDDERVVITQKQSQNYYAAATNLYFHTDASKDVILAGDVVEVDGYIAGNLVVAGGEVLINGRVGGDIYLAGGSAIINAQVDGDVRAATGQLYINSDYIAGDLVGTGGRVMLNKATALKGRLIVAAAQYSLDSSNLPRALNEVTIVSGWGVDGMMQSLAGISAIFGVAAFVIGFLVLLGSYLLDYLLLKLFPVFTSQVIEETSKSSVMKLTIGLAVFIFFPIVVLLLLISGIGAPIAGFLLPLAAVVYYVAKAIALYILGQTVLVYAHKPKTGKALPLLVGFGILYSIKFIPLIGWLGAAMLELVLVAWVVGTIFERKVRALKK